MNFQKFRVQIRHNEIFLTMPLESMFFDTIMLIKTSEQISRTHQMCAQFQELNFQFYSQIVSGECLKLFRISFQVTNQWSNEIFDIHLKKSSNQLSTYNIC